MPRRLVERHLRQLYAYDQRLGHREKLKFSYLRIYLISSLLLNHGIENVFVLYFSYIYFEVKFILKVH